MTNPYYPKHRIPYPKDDDYVPEGYLCDCCGSAEVIWFDKDAQEVECYDCGSMYFITKQEGHDEGVMTC